MAKKATPSLSSLAAQPNPLEDLQAVIKVLHQESKESRHLEWKLEAPIGPSVTTRTKYRTVKAAVSFANADGGFILFGVDPSGKWTGVEKKALAMVDPAHLLELINGCLFPDIQSINFAEFEADQLTFAVLHLPPSNIAPHVTTKDVFEKDDGGRPRPIVKRNTVYYRQGAKSDEATALQHQKIVNRRVERLSDDLVRRVKEVTVPISSFHSAGTGGSSQSITVARLSKDPNAQAVRLTRSHEGTSGLLLHEELSDGLFEEINNVIDANLLLNKGRGRARFVLGDPIYYRIYAERHHVEENRERLSMLFATGFVETYSPYMYWALKLPVSEVAEQMKLAAAAQHMPQVNALVRLVTLLGPKVSDWLWKMWDREWRNRQAPDHYWSLKAIREKKEGDRRLAALRVTGKATLTIPGHTETTYEKLLKESSEIPNYLTKACVEVFGGSKEFRTAARTLDLLAYGADMQAKSASIEKELGLQ